jgi:serine/threonine protein kinase
MNPPGAGTIIAGRYRLTEQLGQGGMGSVWKAEHLTLHSTMAVKLIDPEIGTKPDMLERFQREAQAAASLRSPHVVQVIDYGADEGVPFIAMELLEGESLAARLLRLRRLSNAETVRILTHISRALARAHEAGIVHRDLKPDNVYLVPNDDHEVAKVLDFGVAKHSKLGAGMGPTRTGLILGTPAYMSPEQAQGTKTVDVRSDLWALGVIGYECIVGKVPFESEALGDLLIKICVQPIPIPSEHAHVPAGFDAWFARACCRDTEQRFQSAKELADALRQVLTPDADRSSGSVGVDAIVPGGATIAAPFSPMSPVAGSSIAPPVSGPPASGAPGSAPVSSLPPVVVGPSASARPPGVTVPGMSVALQLPSRRPSAPLLLSVAAVMLTVGAVGAWFAVTRPRDLPPDASSIAHASPADTAAPNGAAVNGAPQTAVTPSVPTVTPAPTTPVDPVPVDPPAAASAKAATAKARGPQVPAQAIARLPASSSPAKDPAPKTPPPATPTAPTAPTAHAAGDQRLGF